MDRRELVKYAGAVVALSPAVAAKALAGSVDVEASNQRRQEPEDGIVFLSYRRAHDKFPSLRLRVDERHELYKVFRQRARWREPGPCALPCLERYLGLRAFREWVFTAIDVHVAYGLAVCEVDMECLEVE